MWHVQSQEQAADSRVERLAGRAEGRRAAGGYSCAT